MHNEDIETFEVDGVTVRIVQDDDPVNPRKEWDNFGHFYAWHRSYDLGDKHSLSVEEGRELAKKVVEEGGMILNVYMYDHSGLTVATHPFSCPWDSGQIGYIYATKKDIRDNWGIKKITKKYADKALALLDHEIQAYDDYLTGNCYGYMIEDPDGEHLDSCWGFLGDVKHCREEATSAAQCAAKEYFAKKAEAERKYGEEHNV